MPPSGPVRRIRSEGSDGAASLRKISNLSRAFTVQARTLEQLDARGLIRSVVLAVVLLDEKPESILTANAVGDAFVAPFGYGYGAAGAARWIRGLGR
ncbi:hypothetical protein [Streptomyces sp. SD15]